MAVVYSNEGLKIDVYFNSGTSALEWSFSTSEKDSVTFTRGFIETIINVLKKSLTPNVEVKT